MSRAKLPRTPQTFVFDTVAFLASTRSEQLLAVARLLAQCKRHDPCVNRSNAGKWTSVTAPSDLFKLLDEVINGHK